MSSDGFAAERPASEQLVAALASVVDGFKSESAALRADIKSKERERRRETRVLLVLVALLLAVAATVLVVAWESYQNNSRIADCTTAGGKCYEEGKVRTGQAITSVLRAQIALGECSRLYPGESGPAYDAKLRACVYQRIQTDPAPAVKPTATR